MHFNGLNAPIVQSLRQTWGLHPFFPNKSLYTVFMIPNSVGPPNYSCYFSSDFSEGVRCVWTEIWCCFSGNSSLCYLMVLDSVGRHFVSFQMWKCCGVPALVPWSHRIQLIGIGGHNEACPSAVEAAAVPFERLRSVQKWRSWPWLGRGGEGG